MKKIGWAMLILAAWSLIPARGAEPAGSQPAARQFVSRHHAVFNGIPVSYVATGGETLIEREDLTPIGYIFSFAYTKEGVADTGQRPVAFIFNGGPGSSSFWLHAAALGPKRAALTTDDSVAGAPYKMIANEQCPLDAADLVFIDPVGTGYSRMLKDGKAADFYGTEADARVTVEFIRRWLSEHNRWNSPKFLIGESYGATRAALTAKLLMGGVSSDHFPAIALNGVVLLGASLDQGRGESDNDLAAALPSMAATAWYHNKVNHSGKTFDAFFARAREFAVHDYLPALFLGNALETSERDRIVAQLHDLLGLPVEVILRHRLRIDIRSFARELLADQGQTVSIYDARFSLPSTEEATDPVGDDPSMTRVGPAVIAGLMSYAREDLGVHIDSRYEPISWVGNHQWAGLDSPYNLALDLGRALRQNPHMHLMIASGYYDLITSINSVRLALSHGEVPPERVQVKMYDSGHMPYLGESNARQFNTDVRSFIQESLRP